jgi:predicted transcriptional regulator
MHNCLVFCIQEHPMSTHESIRLSLSVSPELNARLDNLAQSGHTTKSEVLRKAIALFDVAAQAKAENNRLGVLDQNKRLLSEIIGI